MHFDARENDGVFLLKRKQEHSRYGCKDSMPFNAMHRLSISTLWEHKRDGIALFYDQQQKGFKHEEITQRAASCHTEGVIQIKPSTNDHRRNGESLPFIQGVIALLHRCTKGYPVGYDRLRQLLATQVT